MEQGGDNRITLMLLYSVTKREESADRHVGRSLLTMRSDLREVTRSRSVIPITDTQLKKSDQ